MEITTHAIEQFLSRISNVDLSNIKESTWNKAKKKIEKFVRESEEIQLSPRESLIRLLNNGCKEARYRYKNGVLFVVVENSVVTCYPYKMNKIVRS